MSSNRSMTETPLFFDGDGARLFGLLHSPDGPAPAHAAGLAFVMSHPFGEEKLWSHRVFVSMARALAARGHAVLRFDYMGAGDSSGATSDTSVETHVSDLRSAVRQLLQRHPATRRIGAIGLRLGASIAALAAERAAVDAELALLGEGPLVLWEPVIDGESYFQEILRSNLSTQLAVYGKVVENREVLQAKIRNGGMVNVDGYELGQALFESGATKTLLPQAAKSHLAPALVVQIAASAQAKNRDDLQALAAAYAKGMFARVVEQPFWREIKPFYGRAEDLQQTTLTWLEQQNV
jgi:hypothetical protein